jgi:hypothetical protein
MNNPTVINRWVTLDKDGKKLGTGRYSDDLSVMFRDGKWDITWTIRNEDGTGFFSRVGTPYDSFDLANSALIALVALKKKS